MPHHHSHHHGHSDGIAAGAGHEARRGHARQLKIVLVLSGVYMFVEAAGGLITGSLALLADAGHLLSDVASLVLGLFAIWIAQRPATPRRTYGHTRVEILAALGQGVALVAVALMIGLEAVERFQTMREVNGLGMMGVASGALLVNSIGMLVLSRGRRESINIRGVWLHVASDALGSLGVISAGLVIWLFGWLWADPAVSLLISVLVLFAAWQLVRDALDILMEGAPGHLDVEEIRSALAELAEEVVTLVQRGASAEDVRLDFEGEASVQAYGVRNHIRQVLLNPLLNAVHSTPAGGEVRVRVGLNAGEPIAEDDDLFGLSVLKAARIADERGVNIPGR